MVHSMKHETTTEAVKATPAVLGGTYGFFDHLPLNEMVALATLMYILVQMIILIHKHYYFIKEKRGK